MVASVEVDHRSSTFTVVEAELGDTTSVRRLLCLYIGHSLKLHLSRQSTLLTTETYCVKASVVKTELQVGLTWNKAYSITNQ